MKRLTTKIMTIVACTAMMFTAGLTANTQSVQAATTSQGTINLTTQKLVISKGSKTAMTNNTLQMVKGRRYQVKTKFGSTTVTKTGTYKSSKPAIATVSSTGLVTAKAPGTTTIKVTYNGKSQSFKIKVVDTSAHKHTWKTINKATCASKGKKLCKTCGATGTTAMSTTHSFKITKKATCETKGVETCSVCGLKNTLPKTAHKYVTDTSTSKEGRGKKWLEDTDYCGGCNWDMTNWTPDQKSAHRFNIDAFNAGILSEDCFMANIYGALGVPRYEKYVKVQSVATYCEYCGAFDKENTYSKDLYYVDARGNKIGANEDPWAVWSYETYCKEHGLVPCEGCHIEIMPGKECQNCHIVAPTTTVKKAPVKAVAAPQDVITNDTDTVNTDAVVSDEIITDNEIVSDTEVISDNAIVSDNSLSDNDVSNEVNTDITAPDQDGDIVFDDSDEDDNGEDDYDGSEGDVIEDE